MKVRLLKDHDSKKKGWTIEVPDGVGKKLCAEKIAEEMPKEAPASKSGKAMRSINIPEENRGDSK